MTVYQLDLCDGFARIGVCDTYTFAGALKRNQTGEWQAEIPEGGAEFEGGATIADVDSIIVWDTTRPASVVYAGTVNPTGSVSTGLTTKIGPDGTRWTLSGVDLFGLLGQRIAYPNPATEAPWSTAYDTRTGRSSTVAAGYINANLGSSALVDRQITGVTTIDPEVGDTVTWTARLQPVSTLVTTICNAASIVCRARMTTPGTIQFVFTTGADRTSQTIISEHDLTGTVSVTDARARATMVVAGGSGEGTARVLAGAKMTATGVDRIETFYDVANLTDSSAVALAAIGALVEARAETAAEYDGLTPTQWKYPTHFDVGDLITVEAGGVRYPVLVDGASFTIDPTKSTIRPVLGRTTNNEAEQIMRAVWGTTTRFDSNIA